MPLVYIEFDFTVSPREPFSDILIAELGELGFESFVETDSGILAYILELHWKAGILEDLFVIQNPEVSISWEQKEIPQQNWNAEWEKNFHPIDVDGVCSVRAPFHPPEDVEYDIVIEPKMSFGTGHHETTYMMLKRMLSMDFDGKTVLDMGCGTGVLAILACMKGANYVDAIDIDEWCYINTKENIERNQCTGIHAFHGDVGLLEDKKYDVILANINRNILLKDIPRYGKSLKEHGFLLLSGFYNEDLKGIKDACTSIKLDYIDNLEKNNWVSALFQLS
ncbi:50S ribosomal protein L11 methyltransferase [Flagellimonas meridianipacifica]|uniref:Ribosomal protein L11 methyltransferase n=1 Tax=Flagellimonas meridianipacifica TaxID=1080225 RepID=A0A2T0M8R1_9FLAO|nr:50S ribosomal protein L11 methyltransferase [Allomuricauda pacifica]PRX53926.1 ribosomal protein L11 methyltransferase [Allomuricauda pacifica]